MCTAQSGRRAKQQLELAPLSRSGRAARCTDADAQRNLRYNGGMGLGGDASHARQRAIAGASVVAFALLATNACSDPTQVTVILRTNVPFAQGSSVALWASHSGRVAEPMGTWADPWMDNERKMRRNDLTTTVNPKPFPANNTGTP